MACLVDKNAQAQTPAKWSNFDWHVVPGQKK